MHGRPGFLFERLAVDVGHLGAVGALEGTGLLADHPLEGTGKGGLGVVADVLGRPVHTLHEPGHSGARAAAGWALERLGGGGGDWVRLDRLYEPDASTAAVHEHAQGQFTTAFDALRPLSLGAAGPT